MFGAVKIQSDSNSKSLAGVHHLEIDRSRAVTIFKTQKIHRDTSEKDGIFFETKTRSSSPRYI